MYNVLSIGADFEVLKPIGDLLTSRGYVVQATRTAEDGIRAHRENGADLVLVLLPVADLSGVELLNRLRTQDPRAIVVVCGRDDSLQGAPEALKAGAFEYLADPLVDPNSLLSVISISLGARKSDAELRYLRRKDAEGADWRTIIGRSPPMREVFTVVRRICHRTTRSGAPSILLTGETGTGKGLLAKAIHYNSVRRSRAFVEVNCAALPMPLLEAELFGHTRGAFTDARSSRAGLLETADGGTLFLDEVGAFPLDLQPKLLTTLEERTIRRLGSSDEIHVDVQVVAATNRDLAQMVRQGEFRADLYHRLAVVTMRLPPLRERGEDKLLLAEEFARSACNRYGLPEKRLTDDARQAIMGNAWPGNVRELKNLIDRLVLIEEGDRIDGRHIAGVVNQPVVHVEELSTGLRVQLPEDGCPLELLEREVIRQALDKHAGNVSRAARYLGISRHTLIYRMKKHNLEPET